MRILYIILTLVIVQLATQFELSAQAFQAQYEYDANGNRISATVIFLNRSSADKVYTEPLDANLDEMNSTAIKIYPNPTKGNLNYLYSKVV